MEAKWIAILSAIGGGALVVLIVKLLGGKGGGPDNRWKVVESIFSMMRIREDKDKSRGTDIEANDEPQSSVDTVKKRGEEIKKFFKIIPILLLLLPNGRYSKEISKTQEKIIKNYVDATTEYVEKVEEEFNNIRTNERNDTEIKEVETGSNYKVVEVVIPVKQPFIRRGKDGMLYVEVKDTKPIVRRVVAELDEKGIKMAVSKNGLSIGLGFDIGVSFSSAGVDTVQGFLGVSAVHFSNQYLRISAGVLLGTSRYGLGLYFGPSYLLSNVRIIAAYSRSYISSESLMEVGISAGVFFK